MPAKGRGRNGGSCCGYQLMPSDTRALPPSEQRKMLGYPRHHVITARKHLQLRGMAALDGGGFGSVLESKESSRALA